MEKRAEREFRVDNNPSKKMHFSPDSGVFFSNISLDVDLGQFTNNSDRDCFIPIFQENHIRIAYFSNEEDNEKVQARDSFFSTIPDIRRYNFTSTNYSLEVVLEKIGEILEEYQALIREIYDKKNIKKEIAHQETNEEETKVGTEETSNIKEIKESESDVEMNKEININLEEKKEEPGPIVNRIKNYYPELEIAMLNTFTNARTMAEEMLSNSLSGIQQAFRAIANDQCTNCRDNDIIWLIIFCFCSFISFHINEQTFDRYNFFFKIFSKIGFKFFIENLKVCDLIRSKCNIQNYDRIVEEYVSNIYLVSLCQSLQGITLCNRKIILKQLYKHPADYSRDYCHWGLTIMTALHEFGHYIGRYTMINSFDWIEYCSPLCKRINQAEGGTEFMLKLFINEPLNITNNGAKFILEVANWNLPEGALTDNDEANKKILRAFRYEFRKKFWELNPYIENDAIQSNGRYMSRRCMQSNNRVTSRSLRGCRYDGRNYFR